ncbi:MAG: DUF5331 domain-containing protein [Chlorogloeopsis fritschii C42_A2020_084]|uniref:DUF5331 domain-containing protein n=1 Tax=Chlorogloeopsis fritschii TaxID=1124 RepID=UPI001A067FBF|nr:DUF5331 domain-containing protein [Chlorogloeopsis fritschii]MBF2006351.1 DUF5331 domain-containing protein [Chlorogloeopsis fritschii C42_A2020_084]
MAFFYSFTDSLKQKWLHFFQVNRDWIKLHMEVESVYTPDGGKRPPSYLILGVANALEPKLAQLMLPFSRLNPDADTLIEVLGLNFDPDYALGNCVMPKSLSSEDGDEAVCLEEKLHDETLTIPQNNGCGNGAIAQDLGMSDNHEQSFMVSEATVRDQLRAVAVETLNGLSENSSSPDQQSTNEFQERSQSDEEDEFGDISFDELNEIGNQISATVAPEKDDFTEVLSDVWGDETAALQGESNTDIFVGEELTNSTFDDSEIARLFPNA